MNRWGHPTGERSRSRSLALVAAGLAVIIVAVSRTHDVFGDGSMILSEGELVLAVTRDGPRRPDPPSQLDNAIAAFLGDDAANVIDVTPASPGSPGSGAGKNTSGITSGGGDDFCPT